MCGIRSKKRGHITVFLSLLLAFTSAFFLLVGQCAGIQMARGACASASQMSLESIFGEYQRNLRDAYGIFFLDGGYGSRCAENPETALLERYQEFLSYEMDMEKGIMMRGTPVNWGYGLNQVDIEGIEYITDCGCAPLKRQISAYMQQKTGITFIKELTGLDRIRKDTAEDLEEKERDSQEQEKLYRQELQKEYQVEGPSQVSSEGEAAEGEEPGKIVTGEQVMEEAGEMQSVNSLQKIGILNLILEDPSGISGKMLSEDENDRVSHRNVISGYGTCRWREAEEDTTDNVMFRLYLKNMMCCYGDTPAVETVLDYEKEYLLAGKGSDRENLEAVAGRLLLMREAINMISLSGDTARVSEAEALAITICGVAAVPFLIEPVKWGILLAWSYLESIADLRVLFSGGRLAVVKTPAQWRTSIFHLESAAESLGSVSKESEESGLTYEEWLEMLMMTRKTEKLCLGFLDLAEAQIRTDTENKGYEIDKSIAGVTISHSWKIMNKVTYQTTISYVYR